MQVVIESLVLYHNHSYGHVHVHVHANTCNDRKDQEWGIAWHRRTPLTSHTTPTLPCASILIPTHSKNATGKTVMQHHTVLLKLGNALLKLRRSSREMKPNRSFYGNLR